MLASLALRLLLAGPCLCAGLKVDAGYPGRVLETGLHTIGNRTFYVQLPLRSSVNKFPVVIVLPPTGELDRKFMDTWGHKLDPKLPAHLQHIIVAPHGLYQSNRTTSPAGVTKSTQAPAESVGADTQSDFEFIEALIDHLGEFPNVNGDFRLYGKYRGAELGFQLVHENSDPRITAAALIGGHATEYQYGHKGLYRGTTRINGTVTPRRLLLISGLSERSAFDGGSVANADAVTPTSVSFKDQAQNAEEAAMTDQAEMESTAQAQAEAEVSASEARQAFHDALEAHKAASKAVAEATERAKEAIAAESKKKVEAVLARAKERESRAAERESRAKELEEKAAAREASAKQAYEKAKQAVIASRKSSKSHMVHKAKPSRSCERGVHEAAYGAARRAGYCGSRQKPKLDEAGCRVSYFEGRIRAIALDAMEPAHNGWSSGAVAREEDALSSPIVCSFFGASCGPAAHERAPGHHPSGQHAMIPNEST